MLQIEPGLSRIIDAVRGEARRQEPMSLHSSLKVGGAAELYLEPADLEDLKAALAVLAEEGIPWLVVGAGFNLLVSDAGFPGCVIALSRLKGMQRLSGARLEVEAGVTTTELTHFAARECLSGVEFMAGIPGTVGGALAMNAGAHGCAIVERVKSLTTMKDGELRVRSRSELEYGYRQLTLEAGEIVLSAVLSMDQGECEEIERCMDGYLAHRKTVQRVGYPSAGSFFKNPPGQAAWRLIDEAGLRGVKVGGAQVSEVHTNFLVNTGGATATDFLLLAEIVKDRVRSASGVELEEEVRIVGLRPVEAAETAEEVAYAVPPAV